MAEQQEKTAENNPFSSPTTTSDVVLVVEGRKLHVSKAILAVMSPVFEKMFYGEFKEKDSQEFPLPGKKYEEILEFLLCIYPSTSKPVDKKNVEAVMMLADEYQVERLLDNCIKYTTTTAATRYSSDTDFCPSVTEMIHFLHISESNYNLKKVYEHYIDLVAKNCGFDRETEEGEFSQISLETRYKVVLKRLKFHESEAIRTRTFN